MRIIFKELKMKKVKIDSKDNNDAIVCLISKIKKFKRTIETDEMIKKEEQKIFIVNTLKDDVLPHLGNNLMEKAIYMLYDEENVECIFRKIRG